MVKLPPLHPSTQSVLATAHAWAALSARRVGRDCTIEASDEGILVCCESRAALGNLQGAFQEAYGFKGSLWLQGKPRALEQR